MQITLTESEIKEALIDYVGSQGINLTNADAKVTFFAGRGANNNSATIDIVKKEVVSTEPTPQAIHTDGPLPLVEEPVEEEVTPETEEEETADDASLFGS